MKKNIILTIFSALFEATLVYIFVGRLYLLSIVPVILVFMADIVFWIVFYICYPHKYFFESNYQYTYVTTTYDVDRGTVTTTENTPADQAFSDNFLLNLGLVFVSWATSPISHVVVIFMMCLKHSKIWLKIVSILLSQFLIVAPVVGIYSEILPAKPYTPEFIVEVVGSCEHKRSSMEYKFPENHHKCEAELVFKDGSTQTVTLTLHKKGEQTFEYKNLVEVRIKKSSMEGVQLVRGMELEGDTYVCYPKIMRYTKIVFGRE